MALLGGILRTALRVPAVPVHAGGQRWRRAKDLASFFGIISQVVLEDSSLAVPLE